MAIIISEKGKYQNYRDLIQLVSYVIDPVKSNRDIHGYNNLLWDNGNVAMIIDQFSIIQRRHTFQRGLYHLILSFHQELEIVSPQEATEIGMMVLKMYPDYQSFFCGHENTRNLHLHIIFNNCPIDSSKPKLSALINIPLIQQRITEMLLEQEV